MAAGGKRRAFAFHFSLRICYMFLMSKCRGESDIGLCMTLVLAECRCAVPTFDFQTCLAARFVGRWHCAAALFSGIQFTRHFIEFVVVETNHIVTSDSNVILTRQTCGQRSGMAAASKLRALAFFVSVRICYTLLISLGGVDFEIIPTNNPPVSRLISFSPTYSLLLPWQSSPTGNVGSEAANPVVSRPGRLRTSEIPKPLSVSLVMTPSCHHLPALPSEIGKLRQNWY